MEKGGGWMSSERLASSAFLMLGIAETSEDETDQRIRARQ